MLHLQMIHQWHHWREDKPRHKTASIDIITTAQDLQLQLTVQFLNKKIEADKSPQSQRKFIASSTNHISRPHRSTQGIYLKKITMRWNCNGTDRLGFPEEGLYPLYTASVFADW
jgi:hypothetical protein